MSDAERPMSEAEWRKYARRREVITAAAVFGFCMALVLTLVFASTNKW